MNINEVLCLTGFPHFFLQGFYYLHGFSLEGLFFYAFHHGGEECSISGLMPIPA